MISSEVQRTLVKSPPELWAELSDPASLARHLGEFGEIRITRIDPEQAVEWEAEDASGSVQIKPSAWGTKVTLTATRETVQPEATAPEPPVEAEPSDEAEPTVTAERAVEAEPVAEAEPAVHSESTVRIEADEPPEPAAAPVEQFEPAPELEPRRSFLARLFGRRPKRAPLKLQPAELEPAETMIPAESQADGHETIATEDSPPEPSAPIPSADSQPDADVTRAIVASLFEPSASVAPPSSQPGPSEAIAPVASLFEPSISIVNTDSQREASRAVAVDVEEPAESPAALADEAPAALEQDEDLATAEVTAVLTAVLDRLGAAHHRPFSRG